ncbi:hypothetical protein U3A58_20015 [Algoriphagus sp. C2-6-M1]|uniref:hypothetical protein n=1 Tax=Algoriphagus persicinus TaxID=3108754 RepID=UPI002B3B1FEB|nr:hypothetical protein [Algoriphagus sp. C2-6-M1]MEB2782685.1 hypothetical protein [Algoriphagus sp. C2-6-M1]
MKIERCENHPEGVKPLIAMGETHGKERLKAISLGAGSFLEEVSLCRGMETNRYEKIACVAKGKSRNLK